MMEGIWLSILEYASMKNKSISTVRRYIKAGRIKYKEENGKYFIWTKNSSGTSISAKEILTLQLENQRLNTEIKKIKEELEEAKMLIFLYEQKTIDTPPEVPVNY